MKQQCAGDNHASQNRAFLQKFCRASDERFETRTGEITSVKTDGDFDQTHYIVDSREYLRHDYCFNALWNKNTRVRKTVEPISSRWLLDNADTDSNSRAPKRAEMRHFSPRVESRVTPPRNVEFLRKRRSSVADTARCGERGETAFTVVPVKKKRKKNEEKKRVPFISRRRLVPDSKHALSPRRRVTVVRFPIQRLLPQKPKIIIPKKYRISPRPSHDDTCGVISGPPPKSFPRANERAVR